MHWTSVWAFRLGVRSLTFSFFSSWCVPCVFLCVASFLLFFLCGWGDGVEDGEGGGIVEGGGEGGPPAPAQAVNHIWTNYNCNTVAAKTCYYVVL